MAGNSPPVRNRHANRRFRQATPRARGSGQLFESAAVREGSREGNMVAPWRIQPVAGIDLDGLTASWTGSTRRGRRPSHPASRNPDARCDRCAIRGPGAFCGRIGDIDCCQCRDLTRIAGRLSCHPLRDEDGAQPTTTSAPPQKPEVAPLVRLQNLLLVQPLIPPCRLARTGRQALAPRGELLSHRPAVPAAAPPR